MTTRRRFLSTTTVAFAAPLVLPASHLFGADAPSRQIRLGHIGTGSRGGALIRNFLSVAGATSAALCDPFQSRREQAAAVVKEAQGHAPKLYNDFRELLADDSIDAVIIATPDHWHVPIALAAVRAGKAVYLEKPLGYTLAQNLALHQAIKEHDVVFQYGTQQRSIEICRRGIELVLNGAIGELKEVHAWCAGGQGGGSRKEIPVPEGLDYDLFIGPAPMQPCSEDRLTKEASWYCSDYALGFIAGWGAHPLDFAIWGLDYDLAGPVRYKGTGTFPPATDLFDACTEWDVEIDFGGKIPMRFVSTRHAEKLAGGYLDRVRGDGTTFIGSEGWVCIGRGYAVASNPEWLRLREPMGDRRVHYRPNYYAAFVESVRDGTPSVGPIDDALRSDAISHLSLLAIQSGEELVWDPTTYRILSPESVIPNMHREIRGPWKQT
ncbi:MAG: Gfo/Idh/MocA family protein [Luteolibacter sp.]